MANLWALKREIENDPLNIGYSTMTNEEIAASLMANQSRSSSFPAKDIGKVLTINGRVDAALHIMPALNGFSDIDYTDQDHVTAITNGMDYLISQNLANADIKTQVLALDQNRITVSRAKELGLLGRGSEITANHVEQAKALV